MSTRRQHAVTVKQFLIERPGYGAELREQDAE